VVALLGVLARASLDTYAAGSSDLVVYAHRSHILACLLAFAQGGCSMHARASRPGTFRILKMGATAGALKDLWYNLFNYH
jgi:hypothetical protein